MPRFDRQATRRALGHALVVTAIFAISFVAQAFWPGEVYWSRTIATILPPAHADSRTLEDTNEDPLILAAALAAAVREPDAPARGASPDATLYGEGKLQAVSARVRNEGGQWQSTVREPIVILEVVDSSAAATREKMLGLQRKASSTMARLQNDLQVAADQRIALSFSTTNPDISHIKGNRARTLVGVAAFLLIVVYLVVPAFGPRAWPRRWGAGRLRNLLPTSAAR